MALANELNPNSQPIPAPGRVEYSPSDLMAVLNELAHELNAAKPGVLSKDIKVNRDVVLGLVDELRNSMPVAVEQADVSLMSARQQLAAASQQADAMLAAARNDAEATVASARTEADSIVAGARQKQKELIENENIVAGAKIRAGEIVSSAQAEADRLMADADAYCDNSLAKLGEDLAHLQHQVAAGRAQLAQTERQREAKPAQQHPAPQSVAQAPGPVVGQGQPAGHSQPTPQGQPATQNRGPQPQPVAQPKQSRIAFGGRR